MDMQNNYASPSSGEEDSSLPWPDRNDPMMMPQPLPEDLSNSNHSPDPGKQMQLPADSIDPRLLSLAMGFVPAQIWETPYNFDVALKRGTIFPALDKPLLGEEAVPQ